MFKFIKNLFLPKQVEESVVEEVIAVKTPKVKTPKVKTAAPKIKKAKKVKDPVVVEIVTEAPKRRGRPPKVK